MNYYLRSLMAHKFRSMLSILGIAVGTAAVVGILYSGLLASEHAMQQIRAMGTQMVAVSIDHSSKEGFSSSQMQELELRHKVINAVIPIRYHRVEARLDQASDDVTVVESLAGLSKIIKLDLKIGRFLHAADVPGHTCVIGSNIEHAYNKKGVVTIIGKKLYYDYGSCLVTGILQKVADNFFMPVDFNSSVVTIIPQPYDAVRDVMIHFGNDFDVMNVSSYVLADLHTMLPDTQFFERTPGFLINHIKNEQANMNLLLGVIGGISLLVGGIGIMNIMLVSVVERRQEIGVRLAIGAKTRDIQEMFLMESITICIIGGLIGVIAGVFLSYIYSIYSAWAFYIYYWPLILAFIVSAVVGIFFGYYPAKRAALVDPVFCLRNL